MKDADQKADASVSELMENRQTNGNLPTNAVANGGSVRMCTVRNRAGAFAE